MNMDTLQKIREIKEALNMREPSTKTEASAMQMNQICTITGLDRDRLKSELVQLLVSPSDIPA